MATAKGKKAKAKKRGTPFTTGIPVTNNETQEALATTGGVAALGTVTLSHHQYWNALVT
jgi:hypothetical protein